jgi:ubiquinone/menaquinone biosynthesis C-methylase UbiE
MSSSLNEKYKLIQKNYDRLSHWYDWLEGWGESKISHDALQLVNIQPDELVLEIGSGTGSNLIRILRMGNPIELIGLDLSLNMGFEALKKTHRFAPNLRPDLVNGNTLSLPFESNIFDVLFMLFTFEIIPMEVQRNVLSEFMRVLKPNGRVCVASMSEDKVGLMMLLYKWSIHQFPNVVDCQPIRLAEIFEQGGFRIVKNETKSLWGLPVRIILVMKS